MDHRGSFRGGTGAHEDPNGIDAATQRAPEDIRKTGGIVDGYRLRDAGCDRRDDAERASARGESHADGDCEDNSESRINRGTERDTRHQGSESNPGRASESFAGDERHDFCDGDTRGVRFSTSAPLVDAQAETKSIDSRDPR